MIISFLVAGMASSIMYLIKTYINVFYIRVGSFDQSQALIYLSFCSVLVMIFMPLFGYISDIYGKIEVTTLLSLALLIFIIPALKFSASEIFYIRIFGLIFLSILGGGVAGVAYIFAIYLFPSDRRYSCVSISYNLGVSLFGGSTAAVSDFLISKTNVNYSPAYYIILVTSIFLFILFYWFKEIRFAILSNELK